MNMAGAVRFYPLAARLRRAFSGYPDLAEHAAETIEISPATTVTIPPVIMPEGTLERVTGVSIWTTLERSRSLAKGGSRDLSALYRYVFRDALATPTGFFTAKAGFNEVERYPWLSLGRKPRSVEQGHNAMTFASHIFFGHWIREGLALSLLEPEGTPIFLPPKPDWPHTSQYIERAGIDVLPDDFVHFGEMSFIDLRSPSPRMFEGLSKLHGRLHKAPQREAPQGLFLSRGATGAARDIVNEDDLRRALEDRGFVTLDMTADLETLQRQALGVPLTVSMEGSNLMHALLLARRGAGHLILNPADRFNLGYNFHARGTDARIATTIAERTEAGYRVDIDATLRTLDSLAAAIG